MCFALLRLVLILFLEIKTLLGGKPVGARAVLGPPVYRPLMFSASENNCL